MRDVRGRGEDRNDPDDVVQDLHRRQRDGPKARPHHSPLLLEQLDHCRPPEAVQEPPSLERNGDPEKIKHRTSSFVDNVTAPRDQILQK